MPARLVSSSVVVLVACACWGAHVASAQEKPTALKFALHDGHFERNDTGLKASVTTHAIDSQGEFEKLFGLAAFMGKKKNYVAADAFKTKQVLAVIHRGPDLWEYSVDRVETDDEALVVRYKATRIVGNGSATFAVPLIVSIERSKHKQVRFVENGKEIGQATFGD